MLDFVLEAQARPVRKDGFLIDYRAPGRGCEDDRRPGTEPWQRGSRRTLQVLSACQGELADAAVPDRRVFTSLGNGQY